MRFIFDFISLFSFVEIVTYHFSFLMYNPYQIAAPMEAVPMGFGAQVVPTVGVAGVGMPGMLPGVVPGMLPATYMPTTTYMPVASVVPTYTTSMYGYRDW